ncbi:DUF2971 domain-containing protein [Leptospira montravelensis]|uniref:DUF2971 domain-containing protein n=1 Tax=Leptospira montravelensis TaxID=2484961 RepID=A0ABY2LN14_9LEPT|nr:DUF2971 domain-containing protein [Leptospira montravelensis]TGK80359.1 DUF2971 domain-containing protein [Leptospira montravelensis]TGL00535.1 DUF2971 domain-containing protein [Leptospira montravelensis]
MYKFRSTQWLLNKNELENQELYFSDLDSLNDPMDGFRYLIWKGDEISWKNVFKNYILCLEYIYKRIGLLSKNTKISKEDIPIFAQAKELNLEKSHKIISTIFLSNLNTQAQIRFLSNTTAEISKNDLYVHLKTIHSDALITIDKYYKRNIKLQLTPTSSRLQNFKYTLLNHVLGISNYILSFFPKVHTIFLALDQIHKQMDLIYSSESIEKDYNNWFIHTEFTNSYIDALEKLTYPNSYVCCFSQSCDNSSVWGKYADNHKGVCLIFETNATSEEIAINLKGKNLFLSGAFNAKLEKINYVNQLPKINFFESIGRLSQVQLSSQWLSDENNKLSISGKHLREPLDIWRVDYWEKCKEMLLAKSFDWEYEQEYRILYHDFLNQQFTPEDRKLSYEFDSLKGIIFGVRTKTEEKIKIINIIKEKCHKANRLNFDFYQAEINPKNAKLDIKILNLIKVK